jgi:hypothetical protein
MASGWPGKGHDALLKNSLYARFDLTSGTKHAVFGALRARFVVTFSSTPSFSTGWSVLGSSKAPMLLAAF